MQRNEVIAVLKIIKISYPYFYRDMKEEEALELVELWSMMFENDHAKLVTESVKALICTSKYPPTIADIKEKINFITQPEQMTEIEAWGIVYKAICDSTYNSKFHFDNLPDVIQKLVGSANQLKEWAMIEKANMEVIQSNFMRSYKSKLEHNKQLQQLPQSTKQMIEGLADKFKMITD